LNEKRKMFSNIKKSQTTLVLLEGSRQGINLSNFFIKEIIFNKNYYVFLLQIINLKQFNS
jgi:hypothetical protein